MLSKSTEYAIRALVFVQLKNWESVRPGVIEIAREIDAPVSYTAKILQTLTKHKLLGSMKGRGGGFYFDNNQSNLTLYDVIHVMEGDGCFHKCGIGLKSCSSQNPCPLHEKYVVIRDEFSEMVKTESIHSLSKLVSEGSAVLNHLDQL
jgi:Rrf2 family protein